MKKINKTIARRLWNEGKDIGFSPCRLYEPMFISSKVKTNEEFDKFVNHATYYNCNSEYGKYLHFYCNKEDYIPKR